MPALKYPAGHRLNPRNFKFREIEARVFPGPGDVDAAIINGNYAIPAGLVATRVTPPRRRADSPYVNVVAVRKDDR